MPLYILTICVFIFTAAAVASDVRTRRIPNWLNVTALVAAILFHVCTQGVDGLVHAVGGFAVGFGVLLVLWLIGGGGGGDVKLMGAIGAWMGPMGTLFVFLLSTFFAIFCLMAVVVYQHLATPNAASAVGVSGATATRKSGLATRTLPYAVPAALATWAILLLRLLSGGEFLGG